jgi:hypothetical protein
VLHRAAFGPRELGPCDPQASARAARTVDPNANVVVKAAAWLRENL